MSGFVFSASVVALFDYVGDRQGELLYPYAARAEAELSIQQGEIVVIVADYDDEASGWAGWSQGMSENFK